MSDDLIFDFSDLPQNSIQRQVVATEQVGILCGLHRRVSRRLGKTVFLILSNYAPETLFENSIRFRQTNVGLAIKFHFATHPQDLLDGSAIDKKLGSLRRTGEKCSEFVLNGSPEKGFEIQFSELLPAGFELPNETVRKQWAKIITKGDWEEAFCLLSKSYERNRTQMSQLRDGMTIRKAALDGQGEEQTEAILSLVASKSDNPVLILNAQGKADWANHAFSKLTGQTINGSQSVAASELLFERSEDQKIQRRFNDSLAKGLSFTLEYAWEPKRVEEVNDSQTDQKLASPIWIEFQVTPVRDEDGTIVRWIAIGSNVTQRRQAELAMQAAKEIAESANKAKSDFLAMMSHEIRTPMNAIIGMTELTLGTQLTIDQRECLTTANNSAQALLQILNDILDLSKVEAQRLELEHMDFNVADVTRETLDTLGVLAQRKDLSLRCNFPLDIHQQLIGDPMRLRQILVNLVGNAIKFTSYGFVDVNVELLDQTNDEVTLHYEVRDTGVGIPENKTSRIFEAFFQADASVTRNFGGTGLGLAITSELVRLMGGRLWVESKLGKGSTFHFVLTFKKANRTFVSLPFDAGRNLKGKRILVIDDNSSNRLALSRWMTEWGIETQFSSTGRDGQKLLQEQHEQFDLAIVDVVLPDIDGFEVVEDFVKPDSKVRTPILMFSSDDRTATVERCRAIGLPSYLIKPVSPKTLHTSIQLALGTNRQTTAGQTLAIGGGIGGSIGIEKTDKPLNVLIVDDHASNRKLVSEILKRRGHTWREAGDCSNALQLIGDEEFDVVLMDVQMPDRDGLEATRIIRALPNSNSALPIVALTAYVTEEDRQRCLEASMNDYLAKPVVIQDLLKKVERWGNTIRGESNGHSKVALDDQLLIKDAPAWATSITQKIIVAEDANVTDSRSKLSSGSPSSGIETAQHPFPKALERFGGDDELLRMQMSFFINESPELIQNIQKAIHDSDGKALHLNAHRLKGLVRTYDDDEAAELATQLEEMGRGESLVEAESTYLQLASKVSDLMGRIEKY